MGFASRSAYVKKPKKIFQKIIAASQSLLKLCSHSEIANPLLEDSSNL